MQLVDCIWFGEISQVFSHDLFGRLCRQQFHETGSFFSRVVVVLLRERQQRVRADLLLVLAPKETIPVAKFVERPGLGDHRAVNVVKAGAFGLDDACLFALRLCVLTRTRRTIICTVRKILPLSDVLRRFACAGLRVLELATPHLRRLNVFLHESVHAIKCATGGLEIALLIAAFGLELLAFCGFPSAVVLEVHQMRSGIFLLELRTLQIAGRAFEPSHDVPAAERAERLR